MFTRSRRGADDNVIVFAQCLVLAVLICMIFVMLMPDFVVSILNKGYVHPGAEDVSSETVHPTPKSTP